MSDRQHAGQGVRLGLGGRGGILGWGGGGVLFSKHFLNPYPPDTMPGLKKPITFALKGWRAWRELWAGNRAHPSEFTRAGGVELTESAGLWPNKKLGLVLPDI